MNRMFAVAGAVAVALLASLTQVEAEKLTKAQKAERDSIKQARMDSIYWATRCTLEVVNHSPEVTKLRVGHWWWERQMGIEPHMMARVGLDWDEEHVMVREFWLNGRKFSDRYRFFIPRGTKKYTIVIEGVYAGALVNRSGVPVIVMPPSAAAPFQMRNFGQRFNIKEQPGRRMFTIFFGPDFKRYRVIPFIIRDVRAGRFVETRTEANGRHYIVSRWVDWVGHIEPQDNLLSVELQKGSAIALPTFSDSDDE